MPVGLGCEDFAADSGSLDNKCRTMPNVETDRDDAVGHEKDDGDHGIIGAVSQIEVTNGETVCSNAAGAPQETTTLAEGQGECLLENQNFGKRGAEGYTALLHLTCSSHLVQQAVDSTTFGQSGGSDDIGDSSSPLVFSANWNPWEIGRNSGWSESNPPSEFMASPSSLGKRVETLETACTEAPSKCQNRNCNFYPPDEHRGWLEDFSQLCALLDLDVGPLLAANKVDLKMQEDKLDSSGQHSFVSPALKHEHPGSRFYSHVAKIGEENCYQYAQALDYWVEQLLTSQTEPFCLAVLLIAKASLRQNDSPMTETNLTFPHVVKEWLASQPPIFEQ